MAPGVTTMAMTRQAPTVCRAATVVALSSALPVPPSAALTAGRNATLTGTTVALVNTDPSTNGVTTQVVGLCGFSAAPISDATLAGMIDEEPVFAFPGVAWDWRSFEGYLDAVTCARPATNIVSLVGHTTLRRYAMGVDDRPPMALSTP